MKIQIVNMNRRFVIDLEEVRLDEILTCFEKQYLNDKLNRIKTRKWKW